MKKWIRKLMGGADAKATDKDAPGRDSSLRSSDARDTLKLGVANAKEVAEGERAYLRKISGLLPCNDCTKVKCAEVCAECIAGYLGGESKQLELPNLFVVSDRGPVTRYTKQRRRLQ